MDTNGNLRALLLKDLCGRLPYGVKATTTASGRNGVYTITGYANDRIYLDCPVYDKGDDEWLVESVKSYLRPMSSMTKEERKEFIDLCSGHHTISSGLDKTYLTIDVARGFYRQDATPYNTIEDIGVIDWLNEHHFDYRGLIEKNLALDCTGLHIYD